MGLIDCYPSNTIHRNHMVLEEGCTLYLALVYIDTTIAPAIKEDETSKQMIIPVTDTSVLMQGLSKAYSALVHNHLFIFVLC